MGVSCENTDIRICSVDVMIPTLFQCFSVKSESSQIPHAQ